MSIFVPRQLGFCKKGCHVVGEEGLEMVKLFRGEPMHVPGFAGGRNGLGRVGLAGPVEARKTNREFIVVACGVQVIIVKINVSIGAEEMVVAEHGVVPFCGDCLMGGTPEEGELPFTFESVAIKPSTDDIKTPAPLTKTGLSLALPPVRGCSIWIGFLASLLFTAYFCLARIGANVSVVPIWNDLALTVARYGEIHRSASTVQAALPSFRFRLCDARAFDTLRWLQGVR